MAFIQVQSENPNFTFLIRKNPASGMIVKSLRQGLLFGYYSHNDSTQFNCYFKDSDSQVSYDADKEFEFNDVTRYSSATFVNNCFDEFFHEVLAKDQEHDAAGFQNTVLINCLRSKRKYFEIFARHFKDFELDYEPISTNFFRVRIRTRQSLRKLLSFTGILALINAIQNGELRFVDDQLLIRYAKLVRDINAPYFVRYVFKVNLLRSEAAFSKVREFLDSDSIKLSHGYNFLQRLRFIERNIAGNTIVDLGCGEGRYFSLAKKYEKYYAVDRDETALEKCRSLIHRKQYDNIFLFNTPEDVPPISGRKTILLTEVIEHNTKEDALELVRSCLTPDTRILITTPNRDFNVHYNMHDFSVGGEETLSVMPADENENENEDDTPFRHGEHLFEFSDAEFHEFIQNALAGLDAEVRFFQLGDRVDGVTPQSAAFIDLKNETETT